MKQFPKFDYAKGQSKKLLCCFAIQLFDFDSSTVVLVQPLAKILQQIATHMKKTHPQSRKKQNN